jgi:short-subunit dehydrogenase
MKFQDMRVVLTGATGGIGRVFALRLLEQGAHVLLVARDRAELASLVQSFAFAADRVQAYAADITQSTARAGLCATARQWHGGVNVLINNAGLNHFSLYDDMTAEQLEQCLAVNVHAPMHLCRELLPSLHSRESAIIVNIGSVLGAIGFPGNVAYSASKFAIRGFSEALRRELTDSRVAVKYLAPRATRTAMNSAEVEQMNTQLKVAMDPPERVAGELLALLQRRGHSAVIGWPEKLFVKINAVIPALVDRAIAGQLTIVRAFARMRAAVSTGDLRS